MKRTLKEARDYFNSLLEARNNAKKKAQTEGFDKLTPEERVHITKYDDEHLDVLEEIRALSPDPTNLNLNNGVLGNRDFSEGDMRNFGRFRLTRALRSLSDGKPFEGIEKEVHEEGERQAKDQGVSVSGSGFVMPDLSELRAGQSATGQTSAAGDQGGITVPTVLGGLIEQFWSRSVLPSLGVTRLTGLQGNLKFPVQTTKLSVSELTEIEALTDTEILFDDIDMAPKRRGVTVPYSKQLLLQTSLSVESFLREQFLKAFGAKADVETIAKILATVGIGAVVGGTNGAAPTWNHIVALETAVAANDADQGSLGYLTNTKVRGKLKTTEKYTGTNGASVWTDGNAPLNGYPALVSNYVPSNLTKGTANAIASAIIFGNFQDVFIGQWGVIDFVVDPYTLAKKAQVQVTANTFYDIAVARAVSFSAMKDALTA
ncbi:phage major capsid protein [Emticicia fontis]